MKKSVNSKGLRISKKRPSALSKQNHLKPKYSKPKPQRRPIKSKSSSNLNNKLSQGPIASRNPSKAKLQEKQLLVPRPVGPAFPFGLSPSAFLIPAIPTLVGKCSRYLKDLKEICFHMSRSLVDGLPAEADNHEYFLHRLAKTNVTVSMT